MIRRVYPAHGIVRGEGEGMTDPRGHNEMHTVILRNTELPERRSIRTSVRQPSIRKCDRPQQHPRIRPPAFSCDDSHETRPQRLHQRPKRHSLSVRLPRSLTGMAHGRGTGKPDAINDVNQAKRLRVSQSARVVSFSRRRCTPRFVRSGHAPLSHWGRLPSHLYAKVCTGQLESDMTTTFPGHETPR